MASQYSNSFKKILKLCRFFQYFCIKTHLKAFGPTIISYDFDRAEKTARDKIERISRKHAHSTLI